ncbi:MAG: SDR family oxidoreductase [Acidobacteriota bacterium]|nr:SDR family oxidoreductase [Acidobacteriota bacterium]
MDLNGKVAVVTGGSKGIGFSIAQALARAGASVVISGRDAAALAYAQSRLADEVGADRVTAVEADMRAYDAVDGLMTAAVTTYGGLDILINNAGLGIFRNVADMTLDEWQTVIDTNLTGVFYGCHAAIPHLRNRGGGWIVNVSSLAGKNSFVGAAAYCASKAGLNAFSESLMQEVRYDNIRVSYIMPGSVRTGFGGHAEDAGGDWKLDPDDIAEVVVDLIRHPSRSLPSRVEIRPAKPPRK